MKHLPTTNARFALPGYCYTLPVVPPEFTSTPH